MGKKMDFFRTLHFLAGDKQGKSVSILHVAKFIH